MIAVAEEPPIKLKWVLALGKTAAPVEKPDPPRQFQCNLVGEERVAWPTFVATPGSYAFQMHGDKPARMVLVEETGVWEEPLAKERAEAMGFS